MAPAWEHLAEEWKGHTVGLVAEVDCTAEGKPLCDANGIRGYPTMKYGDPAGLEDYPGGRSYADLAKFATENLKPVCSVANIELCDTEKMAQIEKYMKLSVEELTKSVKEEEKKLEKAEEDFKAAVEKLQAEYQKLSEDKEETITSVKNAGLALMKSVLVAKSKMDEKDEL
jgi:Thioredoxin